MSAIVFRRPSALEIALALLVTAVVGIGLGLSASRPGERDGVERLEAQVAEGSTRTVALRAMTPTDREAAATLCAGSLARHLNALEQRGAASARKFGLSDARMVFGPVRSTGELFVAPVTLVLDGPQEALGQALDQASAWAPSVFFDSVRLEPRGPAVHLEGRGRVVCRAP